MSVLLYSTCSRNSILTSGYALYNEYASTNMLDPSAVSKFTIFNRGSIALCTFPSDLYCTNVFCILSTHVLISMVSCVNTLFFCFIFVNTTITSCSISSDTSFEKQNSIRCNLKSCK
eukprot:NODE_214_length_14327_cov_0.392325.p9 type:complete len:117 gc:universal NODE_214_length_14327_cov_0.392325:2065-1715(-)